MMTFILSLLIQSNPNVLVCKYNFDTKEKKLIPKSHKFLHVENKEGLEYKFYIENYKKPSEENDYLVVSNDKYSMAYPLKCDLSL